MNNPSGVPVFLTHANLRTLTIKTHFQFRLKRNALVFRSSKIVAVFYVAGIIGKNEARNRSLPGSTCYKLF